MKKGCILKSFFILILAIGIGYHLYTEYGRELLEESKEELWDQIGFHKLLGGFWYNIVYALIGVISSSIFAGILMTG